MAQKIHVELICDACEGEQPAQRTMTFGFDSNEGTRSDYQIELCATHLAGFVEALVPWIAKSRKAPVAQLKRSTRSRPTASTPAPASKSTPSRPATGRRPARRDPEQLEGIRIWARAHGFDVGERGRIPAEVEAAYNRRDGLALVGNTP
jgi:hypothetical protein